MQVTKSSEEIVEVLKERSTALLTDHYELTMLQAALRSGIAEHRAVFELFSRKLPKGRRYGVVAGLGRALDALEGFRFGEEELEFLRSAGVVDEDTIEWLAAYRFSGTIRAYREGEVYFPYSPVLTVEATFAEGVILETLLLSILNHDSAIASAASRMRSAAGDRGLIEMGSRRTHEEAAVASARVAYLCGFDASSNLEAGRRYGVPTRGTAAHAFTLGHAVFGDPDAAERAAFRAQVEAQGPGTTLLVDTFDTAQGIRNAVDVAGTGLGAIRIDSGELAEEARRARALLDSLGATSTRIVLTGDLDEYSLDELSDEPVDAYGIGTKLVQGSGHPTASMVFKLVAIAAEPGMDAALTPVAKRSSGKGSFGGMKLPARRLEGGVAVEEVVVLDDEVGRASVASGHRLLQVVVVDGGVVTHRPSLEEIRAHHRAALAELPPIALDLTSAEPVVPTRVEVTR